MSVLENDAYIIDAATGNNMLSVPKGWDLKLRSPNQVSNDKKYEPCINVNQGGRFVKVMLSEIELVKKFDKTPRVLAVLAYLRQYMQYKSNYLAKVNGKPYRAADLARDMGISRQAASVYISQLKKSKVLAEVRYNDLTYLVMNPYYFVVSSEIWESTLKLFG